MENNSLKKNFIYNILYQVLIIILPLITTPYISRVLGADGIGTYSYTYSIAYYFCLFGMLGISNHGNRCIALNKKDKNKLSFTFWNIYTIQLISSTLSILAYIIFVFFIFDGNKDIAYIDTLFIISYLLDINWFFFGMEQFKTTVTRNTIIKVLTVILIFIFVKNGNDLWKYTLIISSGTILSQVYLWLKLKKFVFFVRPSFHEMKKNIKPIILLFIPVISYSIYKVMDKIMLGNLSAISQVGLYENSEKIIGIPLSIITAFGTVMMPRISSLVGEKNDTKIKNYIEISFKYFTIIVSAMVFGLIGISDILAPVYFGEEFVGCAPIISGLSITLLFMIWANIIRTQYLIPNKKDKPYIISMILGAIANFLANIIFIPKYNAIGALIGTLVAEFLVFFVQYLYVKKEIHVFDHIKKTFIYLLFGLIMCILIKIEGHFWGASIKTLVIQIISGGFIYVLFSIIYMVITKDKELNSLVLKLKMLRKR